MSDERIEAVARAMYEQGFGFDIDADPVACESMFSVASHVLAALDRLRAERDEARARIDTLNETFATTTRVWAADMKAAEARCAQVAAERDRLRSALRALVDQTPGTHPLYEQSVEVLLFSPVASPPEPEGERECFNCGRPKSEHESERCPKDGLA